MLQLHQVPAPSQLLRFTDILCSSNQPRLHLLLQQSLKDLSAQLWLVHTRPQRCFAHTAQHRPSPLVASPLCTLHSQWQRLGPHCLLPVTRLLPPAAEPQLLQECPLQCRPLPLLTKVPQVCQACQPSSKPLLLITWLPLLFQLCQLLFKPLLRMTRLPQLCRACQLQSPRLTILMRPLHSLPCTLWLHAPGLHPGSTPLLPSPSLPPSALPHPCLSILLVMTDRHVI